MLVITPATSWAWVVTNPVTSSTAPNRNSMVGTTTHRRRSRSKCSVVIVAANFGWSSSEGSFDFRESAAVFVRQRHCYSLPRKGAAPRFGTVIDTLQALPPDRPVSMVAGPHF